MQDKFSRFARQCANVLGSTAAFFVTVSLIIGWIAGGILFGFGDTYQLIINTISTLTTSLFVVLIQHTQNIESKALHLKLDELLRSSAEARNELMHLETADAETLKDIAEDMHELSQECGS